MSAPEEFVDTLTMAEAEALVKKTANQVAFAQRDYARAGDALIAATIAHRRALTTAEFSTDCPHVGTQVLAEVLDGKEIFRKCTVGEREAWLNRETHATRDALFAAEVMRENSIEALRTCRGHQQAAMSLNASAREAYRSAVPV